MRVIKTFTHPFFGKSLECKIEPYDLGKKYSTVYIIRRDRDTPSLISRVYTSNYEYGI